MKAAEEAEEHEDEFAALPTQPTQPSTPPAPSQPRYTSASLGIRPSASISHVPPVIAEDLFDDDEHLHEVPPHSDYQEGQAGEPFDDDDDMQPQRFMVRCPIAFFYLAAYSACRSMKLQL